MRTQATALIDAATAPRDLNNPAIQRRINHLRRINNWTNWLYLARECLAVALVVSATITFYQYRAEWGLAWAWNIPLTLVAIVVIGACQHRLTTLAHEASHYMLFRNRLLNELAADWLCLFPLWATTHGYRLQHLAHHQFVNDPERDPDVTQMKASGHRFQFPMSRGRFVWHCMLKQFLWPVNLIRYILVRAQHASAAGGGPFVGKPPAPIVFLGALVYLILVAAALVTFRLLKLPWLMATVPPALWLGAMFFFLGLPDRFYGRTPVKCDVPARWTWAGRLTFPTLVFTTMTWLTYLTGYPWVIYYFVLWLVPIVTTFAFFMILRQVVQHGNADQGRLTNTRIFHVGRLIQLAAFPLGMDYHLPHHLFPMVPHYCLRQLHALLLETGAYREQATLVEGYFFHDHPPLHPTVMELIGEGDEEVPRN